jgi:hypothetical protein
MDKLKAVVIVAILVLLATSGAIFFIGQDAINNAKIPDVERGTVLSKAPLSDSNPTNYTVTLSENRVLYIVNNPSLYQSIQVNQTYTFECRIDFNHKMTVVDVATLITPSP